MLGMCPIDAIDQRRAVFAALGPCVDHVADEFRLVAGLAQLTLVVVARNGVHGRKVRRARRVDNEGRQKTVSYEVACPSRDNEIVVVFSKAAGPRRRRQADEGDLRPRPDRPSSCASP